MLLLQKKILEDIINSLAAKKAEKRLGEQEFFLRYSVTNDEIIKKLENRTAELESEQKQKIAEVLKVRRSKEELERLRDEAKRQFIKEQEKIEQKELDEGATIRFARKIIQQRKIDNSVEQDFANKIALK